MCPLAKNTRFTCKKFKGSEKKTIESPVQKVVCFSVAQNKNTPC